LDIRTRDGNSNGYNLEAGLNLFDGNILFEGPIVKDKASFIITARQSILNAYIVPFTRNYREEQGQHGGSAYNFHDINAKINYSLSSKDKFYASWYNGRDYFNDEIKLSYANSIINLSKFQLQDLNWGNNIGSIRWNHVYSNKLFSNTNITYSNYRFRFRESIELVENRLRDTGGPATNEFRFYSRFSSYIRDYAAYTNFDYTPSQQHYLKFGGGFIRHDFQPGFLIKEVDDEDKSHIGDFGQLDPDSSMQKSKSLNNEFFVYVEDEWKPIPELEFNLHFLNKGSFVFPADLWVPSTQTIAPQKSWQVSGGLEVKPAKSLLFSGEVYYKEMDHLIDFQEASSLLYINPENWEDNVTVGRGWAYGAEFILEKKSPTFSSWIAYTLSWTKRHFDQLNFGKVFPFRYDRRHNLKTKSTAQRELGFGFRNGLYLTG